MAVNSPAARPTMMDRLAEASHIWVAIAAVLPVLLMIIRISPMMLDFMLTLNISLALIIMLVSLYTENALSFSVFPTLLLIVTLFRLSLNLMSTRLILLSGYAGHVIEMFGNVIVGGNYAVGVVIFAILIIIQFVVITNGSGRVAEVAARFTLDAMPGKQLAIDADLNAGLITEVDARRRRRDIQRSADFYGAMDGASKFVRGDAIASLIITSVNIIGGFCVGVFQMHLSLAEAAKTFTLLTIGEGIVTQLPALLISTATGIVVTRAASEGNFGSDLSRQLMQQPRALAITSGLLVVFGFVGLPPLLMFSLAGCVGGLFMRSRKLEKEGRLRPAQELTGVPGAPGTPQVGSGGAPGGALKPAESAVPLISYDPMELEIGFGLIPLVDAQQGGDLLDRITTIRRHTARDLGIVVPPIRVRDNLQLKPNAYVIKVYGLEVARAELMVSRLLAMKPGSDAPSINGIETIEPAFHLPALWITEATRAEAEMSGYTVIEPASVIATHLTETIKSQAPDLLGRQETSALLDNVKQHYPVVVDELIPNLLTVGEVQRVLQNLLRERIPIRNLLLILESLADGARTTKDCEILTERVRVALGRHIIADLIEDGVLSVMTVDPRLETMLADIVRRGEDAYAVLDPTTIARVYASLGRQIDAAQTRGVQPILLSSPSVRIAIKRLTERSAPQLVVLAYSEIPPGVRIESIGQVSSTEELPEALRV